MDKKTFKIIDKIANEHSRSKKRFGYFSREDVKNEIWLICLEKLPEFKDDRGELERFLRTTVHNRLINKYKDITKFVHSPCPRCPYYDPGKSPGDCAKFFQDKHLCSKWEKYQNSLNKRKGLLISAEVNKNQESKENIINNVVAAESKEILLSKIDEEYKEDLVNFMNGKSLPKKRLNNIKREVKRILIDDTVELTIKKYDKNAKS